MTNEDSVVKRDDAAQQRVGVFFELFVANRMVGQVIERALAGTGLAPSDYAFYSALRDVGPLTPSELSSVLGAPLTTISEWVRRYEARGHLVRLSNPADGRSYLVALSRSGLTAWRAASRAVSPVFDDVRARFAMPEDQIRAALAAVDAALREEMASPGVPRSDPGRKRPSVKG
ncbi:MAG TPA: MarR family transcriptional regulator [Actinomycetota bacterium]|nr:MarR family transcriptional regulator [Actinomycetota bacterium]